MRRFFVLLFFIFLAFPVAAWSHSYYVDAVNGDDSNPGTIVSPWQSIGKVDLTAFQPGDSIYFKRGTAYWLPLLVSSSGTADNWITYGAYGEGDDPAIIPAYGFTAGEWSKTIGFTNVYQATPPGAGDLDSIWDNSTQGTAYEDTRWMMKKYNIADVDSTPGSVYWDSATNTCYLHAFDSDSPMTNGHNYVLPYWMYAISTEGQDYVRIQDIDARFPVNHTVITCNAFVAPLDVSTNVILKNIDVLATCHNAFSILGQNIMLDHCRTTYTSGDNGDFVIADVSTEGAGQDKPTTNITVKNCDAANNFLWPGVTDLTAFKIEYNPTNVTFENNTVSGVYTYAFGASYAVASETVVVNGLDITGLTDLAVNVNLGKDFTLQGIGIDSGSTATGGIYINAVENLDISKNSIHGGGFSIYLNGASTGTVRVHHNILDGATDACLVVAGGLVNQVDNNILYDSPVGVVFGEDQAASANTALRNNIAYGCTNAYSFYGSTAPTGAWDYNLAYDCTYWGNNTSLAVYQLLGLDLNSLEADPKFETVGTDWRLRADSPAIDAGIDGGYTGDYAGHGMHGNAWDIGIYDFNGASALMRGAKTIGALFR